MLAQLGLRQRNEQSTARKVLRRFILNKRHNQKANANSFINHCNCPIFQAILATHAKSNSRAN